MKKFFFIPAFFLFMSLICPQTLYARGPTPPPEPAPTVYDISPLCGNPVTTLFGVPVLKGTGINSAIGCIPVLTADKEDFLAFILKWAIGIGGGIAFLLIIYAGFIVMTSTGNPERLKAGQELLTSAISGLILLIFSVFILELIGVKILGLPGFG